MKRLVVSLLLVLSVLTLAACGAKDNQGSAGSPPVEAADSTVLRIGILPDTQSVPVAMAAYLGYFEEEGLKVEVARFTSAAERDSALQAGNLDAAISDLIAVALFRQGGFAVSATSLTDGCQTILAGSQTAITDMAGLQGASVALSENTVMEYAFDRLLTEQGLEPDAYVEKTYIPQITVRLEMLQNKQVDAVIMPEPQISVAKQSGAVELSSSDDYALQSTALMFGDEFIAAHPELVQSFYRAYNRAVAYLNGELTAEDRAAIITETGFPETVADILVLPTYREATAPREQDVTAVTDWMKTKGLLTETLSYEDMVDGQFAAK